MGLSYDEIAEIVKIIDGSSCDELIVETGDVKLVVRRNNGAAYSPSCPAAIHDAIKLMTLNALPRFINVQCERRSDAGPPRSISPVLRRKRAIVLPVI